MAIPDSVLIVDDESHIRLFVKMMLKQLGVQTFYEGSSGSDALRLYEEKQPDCVLMDINMPGVDGLEALESIMDFDEEAVVVMLTAQASRDAVHRALELGASQYIRKDVPKAEMKEMLSNVFNEIWED